MKTWSWWLYVACPLLRFIPLLFRLSTDANNPIALSVDSGFLLFLAYMLARRHKFNVNIPWGSIKA
jgi:hypothetical protein